MTLDAEARVVALMRTLYEAEVSYGIPSSETQSRGWPMPSLWNEGSYAELERCLAILREGPQRPLWWHACYRYRFGVEKVVVVRVRRLRKGPKLDLPPRSELIAGGAAVGSKAVYARIYQWSADVDQDMADQGVKVLTEMMFGGREELIQLPKSVLYRRLGLELPDDDPSTNGNRSATVPSESALTSPLIGVA